METDTFSVEEQSDCIHIDPDELPSHDDGISTAEGKIKEASDCEEVNSYKRKSMNQIPNLIDNKRKYMEKALLLSVISCC